MTFSIRPSLIQALIFAIFFTLCPAHSKADIRAADIEIFFDGLVGIWNGGGSQSYFQQEGVVRGTEFYATLEIEKTYTQDFEPYWNFDYSLLLEEGYKIHMIQSFHLGRSGDFYKLWHSENNSTPIQLNVSQATQESIAYSFEGTDLDAGKPYIVNTEATVSLGRHLNWINTLSIDSQLKSTESFLLQK